MISETQCQRYCYEPLELIENFYMAVSSPEPWDCHHRVETIMNCGQKELKAQGCYYHRPAHELIFLPHSEHMKLHNLGRHLSKKIKEKLREAKLGNKIWLGKRHSEETKEKIRQTHLGKRHSEESKEKMRKAKAGKNNSVYGAHWWNDGKSEILRTECPGEGWRRGRLRTGA